MSKVKFRLNTRTIYTDYVYIRDNDDKRREKRTITTTTK